jgi:hypothetical protein
MQSYCLLALRTHKQKRQLTKHAPAPVVVGTAMSKRKPTAPAKVTSKKTPPPPEIKLSTAEPQPYYSNSYPTNEGREAKPSMMKRTSSGSIMNAFANAPPKRPKPKPEETQGQSPHSQLNILEPSKPRPPSPKLAPRVSAKRQKELDEVSRMMEESEPEGILLLRNRN